VSRLNTQAILQGAGVALAIIVPVVIIVRLVAGDDDVDATWQYVFVAFVLAATAFGAAVTGRRERSTPLMHGAMAGGLTFLVAQLVSSVAQGDVPNIFALVFFTLAFMCLGAIGGFLGAR
jgi:putative membrane protein (TIGR04086 family)